VKYVHESRENIKMFKNFEAAKFIKFFSVHIVILILSPILSHIQRMWLLILMTCSAYSCTVQGRSILRSMGCGKLRKNLVCLQATWPQSTERRTIKSVVIILCVILPVNFSIYHIQ